MDSYIDVGALWHVTLYGVLFGIGIVVCYSVAITGGSRLAVARERGTSVVAPALAAAVALAVVAAAIAVGVGVMFDK
jgi:Kef-type K+ transport system membrane component KefB